MPDPTPITGLDGTVLPLLFALVIAVLWLLFKLNGRADQ